MNIEEIVISDLCLHLCPIHEYRHCELATTLEDSHLPLLLYCLCPTALNGDECKDVSMQHFKGQKPFLFKGCMEGNLR